jgi:HD-GYP domain-containing protein (c-di-GMP phosphodiesterase class II)
MNCEALVRYDSLTTEQAEIILQLDALMSRLAYLTRFYIIGRITELLDEEAIIQEFLKLPAQAKELTQNITGEAVDFTPVTETYIMGLGALLHDVGKLLIPKPILQKPEGLTDMEMALVRQHCELGTSSLGTSLPKGCMDIVMQHHERCDGKGYPNGLKGDEISRNARIVMIADAFDTLTAGRPYRTTQEINEAIMILKYDKGKYDQEFISLLEKILVE